MILEKILLITRRNELLQLTQCYAQEVLVADDIREAHDIIRTIKPDLMIVDDFVSPEDISSLKTKTDNLYGEIPLAFIADDKNHYKTNKCCETSAEDYMYIDSSDEQSSIERVIQNLENCPDCEQLNNTTEFFLNEQAASASMAGQSRAAKEVLEMIELVGSSKCNPVLIIGETGTGKEIVAKAIHTIRSPNEQFVAVNCAALTSTLLESELFGHVKGSFTGADRDKTGLLELAGNGTVFLDEISEMPIDLQAKLLRVLQEKDFRKVGGTATISCKALIITSSNRELLEEVENKRFRRDLYYRLSICPIIIKPLRSYERKRDIKLLAEYFLRTSDICPDKSEKIRSLTPLAIEALEKHDWPGNVRELRNVIERAILFEKKDRIGLGSIVIERSKASLETFDSANQISEFSLAKAEHKLIARALHESGWQKTKAAALLGITRATLYAKVKQYNIQQSPAVSQTSEFDLESSTTEAITVS